MKADYGVDEDRSSLGKCTQRGAWKFCRAGRSRCTPGISSGFDLFIDCDLPNRDMQRTARSLHAFFSHC